MGNGSGRKQGSSSKWVLRDRKLPLCRFVMRCDALNTEEEEGDSSRDRLRVFAQESIKLAKRRVIRELEKK